VWRRAAEAFCGRGHFAEARDLFERALRYAPDDPEAVTGLGRALRAAGQGRRAVDVFARAVALAARAGTPSPGAEIELARSLAEVAGDRPAAVARVRAIPPGLPESAEARFLEGRWRTELGDVAGAGIAFGRLRDAVELFPREPEGSALAAMLVEAAELEERERADLHAAQRDLGLAIRLRPRDPAIASRFRRVAAQVAGRASIKEAPPPVPPPVHETAPAPAPPPSDHAIDDERLAQELTDRLRADPRDHATAMELAGALERLGHDLDLLALLSARLDEGTPDQRRQVLPLRRAVLLRLASEARAAGRASEGELYELMAAPGEE
jgi:tetratricopeptide (TPR) repeat protein